MTPAALVCWLVILSSPVLIRRLAPEPVRLKLRITALWLPWCAVVCTLLPALLMWRLGTGGILIAIYLLPFGCMALGMALGKRHGLCPLPSSLWRAPCACCPLRGASITWPAPSAWSRRSLPCWATRRGPIRGNPRGDRGPARALWRRG